MNLTRLNLTNPKNIVFWATFSVQEAVFGAISSKSGGFHENTLRTVKTGENRAKTGVFAVFGAVPSPRSKARPSIPRFPVHSSTLTGGHPP